eukprot:snap_masked-scaffold_7-processed-gene-13.25-mRNA-1 protein AED:0.19 eAED:1.00 QI:0/0/0/1/1/1/2/0/239
MEKLTVVLDLDELLFHSYHVVVMDHVEGLYHVAVNKRAPKKTVVRRCGGYVRNQDDQGVKEVQVKFVKRPGAEKFLADLSELDVNLVFWTASETLYADSVLETFLPEKLSDCRLGVQEDGKMCYYKLLSDKFTENELKRLVIVDDSEKNFRTFKNNAIHAVKWEGLASAEPVDYLESVLHSIKMLVDVVDVTKVLPGVQKDLNTVVESAEKLTDVEKRKRKSFPGFFRKRPQIQVSKVR